MVYNQHPAHTASIPVNFSANITNHHSQWQVYTDGAKNNEGTGAAYIIMNTTDNNIIREEYHKLAAHCSNNQAELWAILQALIHITKNPKKYPGNIDFYTDSHYVLHTLNGTTNQTEAGRKAYLLANNLLKRKNITVNWVQGHSGTTGNERADALARKVTTLKVTPSFHKLPISYIKNYINEKIMTEWQNEWTNSTTGRTTYKFLPSIRKRQQLHHLAPSYGLTQCVTGHGNFPAYLLRFGKTDKDTCDCDDTTVGDTLHYLLDCPHYDSERQEMIGYCLNNGQNWPPQLDFLCTNNKAFRLLNDYIKSCTIYQTSS
ncbi:uncharacterized protein [Centruroides vittatus]|uniref:uncharacterized protein n=1 Tax=Centruroides vittatus TaxID=120091 RepID=UPI00350FF477